MERSQEEWDVEMHRLLDQHFGQEWNNFYEGKKNLSYFCEFIGGREDRLSASDFNTLFSTHLFSSGVNNGFAWTACIPEGEAYGLSQLALMNRAAVICHDAEDLLLFMDRVKKPYESVAYQSLTRVIRKIRPKPSDFADEPSRWSLVQARFVAELLLTIEATWEEWYLLATELSSRAQQFSEEACKTRKLLEDQDEWFKVDQDAYRDRRQGHESIMFMHRTCLAKMDEIVRVGAQKLKLELENK